MHNKAAAFSVTIGDSPNEISKAKNSVILKNVYSTKIGKSTVNVMLSIYKCR